MTKFSMYVATDERNVRLQGIRPLFWGRKSTKSLHIYWMMSLVKMNMWDCLQNDGSASPLYINIQVVYYMR